MQDVAPVFKTARRFYDSNSLIRSYVDMCCVLSLEKAIIRPHPDEPWLESLSDAVLDYWKVGELFIDKRYENIVYCDPVEVKTGVGSTASDTGYKFDFPDAWIKLYRRDPLFMLNIPEPYAVRGLPIAYNQLRILLKQENSGQTHILTEASFGLNDPRTVNQTVNELVIKIMNFRRKLGKSLNLLWPNIDIDFFIINSHDVLQASKKFGFLK